MTAYISRHIKEKVPGKRLLLDRLFHGFYIGVALLAVLSAGVGRLVSGDAFVIIFVATLTALGIKIYSEARAPS